MTEKQEKSSEQTKEKDEAATYFARHLAGVKNYDTPFYYLWSEFLGGLAIASFKFWIMYLTNEEEFRKGLEDSPQAIIDAVLTMWKVKTINQIDKDISTHEKMMNSPYGKMFGKLMSSAEDMKKDMYKAVDEVQEKARKTLYDGIIATDANKTE